MTVLFGAKQGKPCSEKAFPVKGNIYASIRCLLLTLLTAPYIMLLLYAATTGNITSWILITRLGDTEAYIALTVLLYTFIEARLAIMALLTLSLSSSICILLKDFFAMPRPSPNLWKVPVSGYSFPSGHATISSSFWSLIYLYLGNHYFIPLIVLVVLSVSFSRVILGVHYLEDVLAGIILGLSVSLILYKLYKTVKTGNIVRLASLTSLSLIIIHSFLYGTVDYLSIAAASIVLILFSQRIEAFIKMLEDSPLRSRAVATLATVSIAAFLAYLSHRFSYNYITSLLIDATLVASALAIPPILAMNITRQD